MASSELTVNVSLEKTLHDAIRTVAEEFAKKDLYLDRVDIGWIDVSSAGKAEKILGLIDISTQTKYR